MSGNDQDLWKALQADGATLDRLRHLARMVEKWSAAINLVARSTRAEIWTRHVEDSARLVLHAPERAALWLDLGSGGGFPGLVVAVLLDARPHAPRVMLVESDRRKAVFLQEAARELALAVEIRAERIEELAPVGADIISARALAPLDRLCAMAAHHGAPGMIALFPKGGTWPAEVAEARKNWHFQLTPHADPSHPGSAVLELGNLRRAAALSGE